MFYWGLGFFCLWNYAKVSSNEQSIYLFVRFLNYTQTVRRSVSRYVVIKSKFPNLQNRMI